VRVHRERLGLTLDQLGQLSGVSRAMLSRVERAESSPTASLLSRICGGLGITLSALMAGVDGPAGAILRRADQETWRDPETGYVRRLVSPPAAGSAVELTEVELPPGARVAFGPSRTLEYDEQVYLLAGRLVLAIGEERHELRRGDLARFTLDRGVTFENVSTTAARYLIILRATTRLDSAG
jgi:transcriptional regulator with XRE-family HTH domain